MKLPPLRERLTKALTFGILIATGLSIFVVVMRIVMGPTYGAQTGLTVGAMIGFYYLGGILAALIAVVLWPLGRTLWGRMIIGFVIAWLVVLAYAWHEFGGILTHETLLYSLLAATITGPGVAAAFWTVDHPK